MRFFKFQPGDRCVTQNSVAKPFNNGLAVVVVKIDPLQTDSRGRSTPYLIERVDRDLFPFTESIEWGTPRWFKSRHVHCAEHKLRRWDLAIDNVALTVYENSIEVLDAATV